MIIDTSNVSLTATHSATTRDESRQTLRAWIGDSRPDFEGREARKSSDTRPAFAPAALTHISDMGRSMSRASMFAPPPPAPDTQAIDNATAAADNDPKMMLIRLMIEMLTGHKIHLMSIGDVAGAPAVDVPSPDVPQEASAPAAAPARAGFGIEYDSHQVHAETEQTQFHADVVVHTTDGQEIHATLDLAMSRSFVEQTDVSIRAGDAVKKDPLVVNFGGTAAQLQSQRVSFDLAGDGQQVQMPMLSGGSGYLALDLNGNHMIDSGTELFGATSGNGFADLARYDSDGNGWIDENDPVFKQLSVWTPVADANGNAAGNLSTLAQSGVGALYLGQVATPFALKDGANSELGAVRASGIFLNEDGSAGTLQQIDLMV